MWEKRISRIGLDGEEWFTVTCEGKSPKEKKKVAVCVSCLAGLGLAGGSVGTVWRLGLICCATGRVWSEYDQQTSGLLHITLDASSLHVDAPARASPLTSGSDPCCVFVFVFHSLRTTCTHTHMRNKYLDLSGCPGIPSFYQKDEKIFSCACFHKLTDNKMLSDRSGFLRLLSYNVHWLAITAKNVTTA